MLKAPEARGMGPSSYGMVVDATVWSTGRPRRAV